ncbi:hypothetical protein TNCV_3247991 [Trichonephila clavipes]|nr:hypothetical protein TNCV_3247991 [Trichonephila clavipes]
MGSFITRTGLKRFSFVFYGRTVVEKSLRQGISFGRKDSWKERCDNKEQLVNASGMKEWFKDSELLSRKTFALCTKTQQASLDPILDCLGLSREELFSSPLLVLDFLRVMSDSVRQTEDTPQQQPISFEKWTRC